MSARRLDTHPAHLGLGATVTPQPAFAGDDWYEAYAARTAGDGAEGRLVSMHAFDGDWTSWEMHPAGEELVLCVSGAMVLRQEAPDGTVRAVTLGPGDYVVNPPGVWHTADIPGAATAVFITAGQGTLQRPR